MLLAVLGTAAVPVVSNAGSTAVEVVGGALPLSSLPASMGQSTVRTTVAASAMGPVCFNVAQFASCGVSITVERLEHAPMIVGRMHRRRLSEQHFGKNFEKEQQGTLQLAKASSSRFFYPKSYSTIVPVTVTGTGTDR